MEVDFSKIEDVDSFLAVPAGTYLCRIGEVREGLTRDGHPRWAFRLDIAEGDHAGRIAAWDGLSWSERGLPHTKNVLSQLGFDVSGTLELEAEDLEGLVVRAELQLEEREDPRTGRKVVRLRVPYHGYQAAS